MKAIGGKGGKRGPGIVGKPAAEPLGHQGMWACGQGCFVYFYKIFFGNFLLLLRRGFKSACEATLFSSF